MQSDLNFPKLLKNTEEWLAVPEGSSCSRTFSLNITQKLEISKEKKG